MQQDWLDKDFYKVLGVSDDVEEKELTKAYRKLARKYHPDANPDDAKAEERFKEVSEAYDVLSNAKSRAEYDQLRKYGPAAGMFGGGARGGAGGNPFGAGSAGGGGFSFDPGNIGDLGDILGGLFGGGGRGGAPGARPRKGDDLEAELNLGFDDAVNGVTTSVNLTSDMACDTCHGSGAAPGTQPETCPNCRGRGVVDDDQGFFSFSQPCPTCSGRGRVVTNPCSSCRGSGIERKPRNVKVRVPAGVKDGQRIRLKGRGAPGPYGGPPGDLFVRVKVGNHKLFGRKGDNLTIEVPITFAEAALGATISVPTLEGKPVSIKVPAGTPTGKRFRIKGRGVSAKKSTGDLLVTVVVDVPTELSVAQQAAIEALADVTTDSPRQHLNGTPTA